MSVMVTVEFRFKPESYAAALDILKSSLGDTRNFEGCIKLDTYVDDANSNVLLVEEWEAISDQEKYMAWRMETGFIDVIGPLIAEAPVSNSYALRADI
jgi:quinol monooxygenase YgiN